MAATHLDFARAMSAAQSGDSDALADLWRLVNPRLLGYLRVTAPEFAADVASATWVKAAQNLQCYRSDEPTFRALLVRIARDETLVRRRGGRRRPDRIIDLVRAEAAGDPGGEVVRLVSRLPQDVAEMVALRVIVGLSAEDTAELVDVRPGAVRVAVQQGLRRTADALVPERPAQPCALDPWALDRLLDHGESRLQQLDPALQAAVRALSTPGSPGDEAGLLAAQRTFARSSYRAFAFGPLAVLAFLGGRLSNVRTFMAGKATAVVIGTVVLSAPAAVAYSEPVPDQAASTPAAPSAPDHRVASFGPLLPTHTPVAVTPASPARPQVPSVLSAAPDGTVHQTKPKAKATRKATTRTTTKATTVHATRSHQPSHRSATASATAHRHHHQKATQHRGRGHLPLWYYLYLLRHHH